MLLLALALAATVVVAIAVAVACPSTVHTEHYTTHSTLVLYHFIIPDEHCKYNYGFMDGHPLIAYQHM